MILFYCQESINLQVWVTISLVFMLIRLVYKYAMEYYVHVSVLVMSLFTLILPSYHVIPSIWPWVLNLIWKAEYDLFYCQASINLQVLLTISLFTYLVIWYTCMGILLFHGVFCPCFGTCHVHVHIKFCEAAMSYLPSSHEKAGYALLAYKIQNNLPKYLKLSGSVDHHRRHLFHTKLCARQFMFLW